MGIFYYQPRTQKAQNKHESINLFEFVFFLRKKNTNYGFRM